MTTVDTTNQLIGIIPVAIAGGLALRFVGDATRSPLGKHYRPTHYTIRQLQAFTR